jgi:hypothetical protein
MPKKKYFEIVIVEKDYFVNQRKRTNKIIFRFYENRDEIIINDVCYGRTIAGEIIEISGIKNPDDCTKYPK